jgi:exosortase D (VPLPA-CTERM-specific)
MVPLPDFLGQKLTAGLQLISSKIGVAVIRAAGLPVFLEGNVIDLGIYKLQVAEACSGMRYLFPLLSFGFLCAVLFRGHWWQKLILIVSTVPITIFMNSFRIGVIGILVNRFGIEHAEGFLHDFEGWVIFMASVLVLFAQVWVFARLQRQPFNQIFGLDVPPVSDLWDLLRSLRPNAQILAAIGVVCLVALLAQTLPKPPVLIPERAKFATFPTRVGEFEGQDAFIDQIYLDQLKVSDYLSAGYGRPSDPAPIGVWIAYYDSQVKGAAVHSPQACLPGGGWQIRSLAPAAVPNVLPDGGGMTVNRVEIAQGEARQLVYYWFAQRGRILTNEYAVKWFIFWDGLTRNRTDGALVRLATYVSDESGIPAADARLQEFMRAADPKLVFYLPDGKAVTQVASAEEISLLESRSRPREPET